MLGQNDKNCGGTNGEFSNDHKVFNFAKSEVFKNASVRKPARQNEIFGLYTRSIGCLPYDTTCFRGSSGSPVFEMNGYIVAMHTQGYVVKKEVENVSSHEQENVPNHEQESISNLEQESISNLEQESISNLEQESISNLEQESILNLEQENVPNHEQENVPNYEQEIIPNHEQITTRTYSLMEFGVQFISICTDIRIWHGDDIVQRIFPNYLLEPGEEPMDLN